MAGKVRLAIKRQELARNMIKIGEKNPKNNIFLFFARKVFNSALYLGGPYDFAAYAQKSWILNGLCNIAFAHPACCFDGGDCGCTTCLHVSYQIQAVLY